MPLTSACRAHSVFEQVAFMASPSLVKSDERVSPRVVFPAPPGALLLSHMATLFVLMTVPVHNTACASAQPRAPTRHPRCGLTVRAGTRRLGDARIGG